MNEQSQTQTPDPKKVIQIVWESLNGCVYDLEEGNAEDALTTIHELIALLEQVGAN